MDASGPTGEARLIRAVLAGAYAVGALTVGIAAVVRGQIACGESCDSTSLAGVSRRGWEHYSDSWQWQAIALGGLAVILLAVFVLVARRSEPWLARAALAAQAAVLVAVAIALAGTRWSGFNSLLLQGLVLGAGAALTLGVEGDRPREVHGGSRSEAERL